MERTLEERIEILKALNDAIKNHTEEAEKVKSHTWYSAQEINAKVEVHLMVVESLKELSKNI